jgi:exodeoxyribonuclease I
MSVKKSTTQSPTFLFHDYETYALDPKKGKASQFASIRTDENLNIIPEDKINIFCEITPDYLPSPDACLITGQTPNSIENFKNKELESGIEYKDRTVLNEDKFALKIIRAMTKSKTCVIGYNNIRFDDEWSRNIFYRTLRNPYAREWQAGCSRADVFKIVLFAYAVDPLIMNFPQAKDRDTNEPLFFSNGNPIPSFKLEDLASANGISHEHAHDAFSDVEATIGILKIIKEKRADIFKHAMDLRLKKNMKEFIFNNQSKPLLHTSSFYGKEKSNASAVMFLCYGSNINNAVFINLNEDISDLLTLDASVIKERLYMKKDDLEALGLKPLPIRNIPINQCEILSKLNFLQGDRAKSIGLDGDLIRKNRAILEKNKELLISKAIVFTEKDDFKESEDVDFGIYNGFFSSEEEKIMKEMHLFNFRNELHGFQIPKEYKKLSKMFFRFKARNYPELLGVKELDLWKKFQYERVTGHNWNGDKNKEPFFAKEVGEHTVETYLQRIKELREIHKDDVNKNIILDDLILYVKNILPNYPIE